MTDNTPTEGPTMREKSDKMASIMKMFLPIVDMTLDEFDLDHATEMVEDMFANASRYDSMAIVTPSGWQKTQSDLLKLQAENVKAIIALYRSRIDMRANALERASRSETQNEFNKIFGINS